MKLTKKSRPPAPPRPEAFRPDDLGLRPGGRRLGEILVDANLVTREQVVAALMEAQRDSQPKLLGQRLIEHGVADERKVAWAVARQHSLEYVDLRELAPEAAATKLLAESHARALTAIPLAVHGEALVVAVAFPSNATVSKLREVVGRPLTIKVAAASDILRAVNNNYRALTGIGSQVKAFEAQHSLRKDAARPDAAVGSDDAPVVQVVQLIITQALRDRASDVHIEPHQERVRVRYRIDGALHDVLDLPAAMGRSLVSRIKIMADMNIVERRRPQDGQISMDDRRAQRRHPRLDHCGHLGREGRHAAARQEPPAVPPRPARHARAHA